MASLYSELFLMWVQWSKSFAKRYCLLKASALQRSASGGLRGSDLFRVVWLL